LALTPGTRLGPDDVSAPIGDGGMEHGFRARETKRSQALGSETDFL
jgi:hypothetical protein